ncbi:hypothetical protein KC357_g250 [Hortaea werneckii]|nr:hypothetical protein KC357_g250 [Hortaea werneckii]
MLATLRVSEIGAIVLVDRQTQTTFEGADVVLEEVGILVKIDCFEGQLPQTLTAVSVGGRLVAVEDAVGRADVLSCERTESSRSKLGCTRVG